MVDNKVHAWILPHFNRTWPEAAFHPAANAVRAIISGLPIWQSTDTAPSEGWVWICYFDSTGLRQSDAWVSDGGFFLDPDCGYEYEPEAWMPLPEPPEGS